jgi:hypothetical protein
MPIDTRDAGVGDGSCHHHCDRDERPLGRVETDFARSVRSLRLRKLAHARPRFGYRRLHVLLRRKGWSIHIKRVRRLYPLQGVQLFS